MNSQFLICTLLFLAYFTVTTLANPLTEPLKIRENNMTVIGQIGDKVLFKTVRQDLNWKDVEVLCGAAGLQFAKLENYAETSFVNAQLPGIDVWIGGRLKAQEVSGGNTNATRSAFEWSDGSSIAGNIHDGYNFLISAQRWLCTYTLTTNISPGLCLSEFRSGLCQLLV